MGSLSLGLGLGLTSVRSGGGVSAPLAEQVVGSRGEISAAAGSATTSANVLENHRVRQFFGNRDVTTLKVAFNGFYVDTSELNAPNSVTLSAAVEYNGVTVRCTWGGSNSITIAAGNDISLCDELVPGDFGASVFGANDEHWIRIEREVVSGGRFIYHATGEYTTVIAGESCVTAATGSASQLLNTGDLTVGGAWSAASLKYIPAITIGRPASTMMGIGIGGASIENGVSDDGGDGTNDGGGYLRRALNFIRGEKIARCNIAKSGESALQFVNSHAKRAVYFPYFTHYLEGHGGNDYSTGETVGDTLTRLAAIWGYAKSGGVANVIQISLSPKTDGDWTTVAGQTPRANFETGGTWRDFANTSMQASVATDANLDGYFDISPAQVDSVELDTWQPNSTTDGTHHNKRMSGYAAQRAITLIEDMHSSYIGAYANPSTQAELTTLLAAMAVQPSANRINVLNEFIYLLKECGAWSVLDIVQMYEAHTQQAALLNWKNPGTFNAAFVGTPVWTEDAGIATITGGNYVDTGFNPSTAGGSFTQNSATFAFSIIGGGVANAASLCGFFNGTNGVTCAPCTGTQISSRMNEAAAVLGSNTFVDGFFALTRSASNVTKVYREGSRHHDGTAASSALANGALRIGSISGATSQARTWGMCLAGGALTPAQHTAVAAAYKRFRTGIAAT